MRKRRMRRGRKEEQNSIAEVYKELFLKLQHRLLYFSDNNKQNKNYDKKKNKKNPFFSEMCRVCFYISTSYKFELLRYIKGTNLLRK